MGLVELRFRGGKGENSSCVMGLMYIKQISRVKGGDVRLDQGNKGKYQQIIQPPEKKNESIKHDKNSHA